MRTTVTLDPDVEGKLREIVRVRGVSFKQALNDAVRAGVEVKRSGEPFVVEPWDWGLDPEFNIDKAIRIVGEWEDEDAVRKMRESR